MFITTLNKTDFGPSIHWAEAINNNIVLIIVLVVLECLNIIIKANNSHCPLCHRDNTPLPSCSKLNCLVIVYMRRIEGSECAEFGGKLECINISFIFIMLNAHSIE